MQTGAGISPSCPGAMPIAFPDSKILLQDATARLTVQDARAESQAFDERSSVLLPTRNSCLPPTIDPNVGANTSPRNDRLNMHVTCMFKSMHYNASMRQHAVATRKGTLGTQAHR